MMTRRREFLIAGAVLGVSGIAAGAEQAAPTEDVSAIEDLMREHGVLRRILLIYEECLRRLRVKAETNSRRRPAGSVDLVRKFVEDYHEKLEETFLFPEFEKRGEIAAVGEGIARAAHGGPRVDDHLPDLLVAIWPDPSLLRWPEKQRKATWSCEAFIRMYRPHAAREDTVLFPALRKILSAKQLDELGDKFEAEEDRRFGAGGFEKIVQQVAAIEKTLGIYDLGQFTPKTK